MSAYRIEWDLKISLRCRRCPARGASHDLDTAALVGWREVEEVIGRVDGPLPAYEGLCPRCTGEWSPPAGEGAKLPPKDEEGRWD